MLKICLKYVECVFTQRDELQQVGRVPLVILRDLTTRA